MELKKISQLPDDIIQSTWSGIVSRSRNSSQILRNLKNIFAAGCYNGSGIGVGILFGEQIAIKASGEYTEEIKLIESRKKPTWLPPDPFNLVLIVDFFMKDLELILNCRKLIFFINNLLIIE